MQVFKMWLLGGLMALSIATVISVIAVDANTDDGRKYILISKAKNIWPAYVYKVVDFERAPNVSFANILLFKKCKLTFALFNQFFECGYLCNSEQG
jgi:hypothetical protein